MNIHNKPNYQSLQETGNNAPAASEQASKPAIAQTAFHYASTFGQHVQRSVASFCAYSARKEVPVAWGKISLPNDAIQFRGTSADAKKVLNDLSDKFSKEDLENPSKELVLTHGYFRNYFQLKDKEHVTPHERTKSEDYFSSMLDKAYPKLITTNKAPSEEKSLWGKPDEIAVPAILTVINLSQARSGNDRPIHSALVTLRQSPEQKFSSTLKGIQQGPVEHIPYVKGRSFHTAQDIFIGGKKLFGHHYEQVDPSSLGRAHPQGYSFGTRYRPVSELASKEPVSKEHAKEDSEFLNADKTAGLFIDVSFSGSGTKRLFFVPLEKVKTFCDAFQNADFQVLQVLQKKEQGS